MALATSFSSFARPIGALALRIGAPGEATQITVRSSATQNDRMVDCSRVAVAATCSMVAVAPAPWLASAEAAISSMGFPLYFDRAFSLIEFQGGKCHLVDDPTAVVAAARTLAADLGGHFMDQFTYAERATDWRGNNNIAESVFAQMALERHPVPTWVVVGAGTGGTSATFGRYVRYRCHDTRVCVVDPEGSAFLPAFGGADRVRL